MRNTDLDLLTRRRPFRAFRIHVLDGSVYDVRHPDQIAVTKSTVEINAPENPEQEVFISLLHITKIVTFPPAAKLPANGPA